MKMVSVKKKKNHFWNAKFEEQSRKKINFLFCSSINVLHDCGLSFVTRGE